MGLRIYRRATSPIALLIVGFLVIGLSDVLDALFEDGLVN